MNLNYAITVFKVVTILVCCRVRKTPKDYFCFVMNSEPEKA